MPSTAQVAQQSKFFISGTPGTAYAVTTVTKATKAAVTYTSGAIPAAGDVLLFGTITGMPEISGMLGIVQATPTPTATGCTVAIDSSGFASAGTTGTATPQTFVKVANVVDFTPDGGSTNVTDVSNLESAAKEKRQGLQDMGNYALTFDTDDTDAGQLALLAARSAQAVKVFKQTYPGGVLTRAFQGFVQKIAEPAAGVDKVLRSTASVVVTGNIYRG